MLNKEIKVEEDFTLMSVSVRTDSEGRQHVAVHYGTKQENPHRIESIPWGELIGRTITGLSMEDGRLVIGLSVKK